MGRLDTTRQSRRLPRSLLIRMVMVLLMAILLLFTSIRAFLQISGGYLFDLRDMRIVSTGAVAAFLFWFTWAAIWMWKRLGWNGGISLPERLNGRRLASEKIGTPEFDLIRTVEEMAVTCGYSVPRVYLVENVPGINACMSGDSTRSLCLSITRPAIEQLNGEELRGIIGHEFGRVLRGDLVINRWLSACLFALRSVFNSASTSFRFIVRRWIKKDRMQAQRREEGYACLFLFCFLCVPVFDFLLVSTNPSDISQRINGIFSFSLILLIFEIFGAISTWFLQSAYIRNASALADSASPALSGSPASMIDALDKIRTFGPGSFLGGKNDIVFRHYFLADPGVRSGELSLFSAHVPLDVRIAALERDDGSVQFGNPEDALLSILDTSSAAASFTAGRPDHGKALIDTIPSTVYHAVHHHAGARAVVLGLIRKRLEMKDVVIEADVLDVVQRLKPELDHLSPFVRLPLIELAIPALKTLPGPTIASFLRQLETFALKEDDGSLFGFALFKVVEHRLNDNRFLFGWFDRWTGVRFSAADYAVLLGAIAFARHRHDNDVSQIFDAGIAPIFPDPIQVRSKNVGIETRLLTVHVAMNRLKMTKEIDRREVVHALAQCIFADPDISIGEIELLRAVSIALDYPLPPMIPVLKTEEHSDLTIAN